MVNYAEGKIYKLVSSQTKKIYIGSTAEHYLCSRLKGHRSDYKKWKNNQANWCCSFDILKYDDVEIILIEEYPCNTKDKLRAREQKWLNKTPNCCNKWRAYVSKEDRLKEARERSKECQNIKILCIHCGQKYRASNISYHKKTNIHKNNKKWTKDYLNSL
jgi:hypothetical protein